MLVFAIAVAVEKLAPPLAPVSALQAWFAANGTYAGAILPDASGVTVARADSTGYCVETGDTTTGMLHELGPGGTPQPGPC